MVFSGLGITILEHAWAEIEHDRNYKYRGLPLEIQRRLYLISGTLEILDDQFEQITKTIEDYKLKVIEKTRLKDLDILINSTSLIQYLKERFKDLPLERIHAYNDIEYTLRILKLMEIKAKQNGILLYIDWNSISCILQETFKNSNKTNISLEFLKSIGEWVETGNILVIVYEVNNNRNKEEDIESSLIDKDTPQDNRVQKENTMNQVNNKYNENFISDFSKSNYFIY